MIVARTGTAMALCLASGVAFAQANGDPGAASNGATASQREAPKSGANSMQKGRSGNSGEHSPGMGGSNAMSGSGDRDKH